MAVKRKKRVDTKILLAIAVILFMIITITVSIVSSGRHTCNGYTFSKSVACGIDVSEHNNDVEWKKAGASVDFAFIRVGYRGYATGEIVGDRLAHANLRSANRAGVPVGVYFYSQATDEAEAVEEAEFAVEMLRHYSIQLPVIIDFEFASDNDGNNAGRLYNASNSPDENARIINAFFDTVEAAGYSFGVYASSALMADNINMKRLNGAAVIWVADYNENVSRNIKYDIWQYSKTGECDGVNGAVDLNYWYTDI